MKNTTRTSRTLLGCALILSSFCGCLTDSDDTVPHPVRHEALGEVDAGVRQGPSPFVKDVLESCRRRSKVSSRSNAIQLISCTLPELVRLAQIDLQPDEVNMGFAFLEAIPSKSMMLVTLGEVRRGLALGVIECYGPMDPGIVVCHVKLRSAKSSQALWTMTATRLDGRSTMTTGVIPEWACPELAAGVPSGADSERGDFTNSHSPSLLGCISWNGTNSDLLVTLADLTSQGGSFSGELPREVYELPVADLPFYLWPKPVWELRAQLLLQDPPKREEK